MKNLKNTELDDEYITEDWDALVWSNKKVRIISQDIDSEELFEYEKVKNEIFLKNIGRRYNYCLVARYLETRKRIHNLVIQRFTKSSGNPHKLSMSFNEKEIEKLFGFICDLQLARLNIPLNLKNRTILDASDEELKSIGLTKKQLEYIHHKILIESDGFKYTDSDHLNFDKFSDVNINSLLIRNPGLVNELLKSKVTTEDIVAVGFRKNQLDKYVELLNSSDVNESVWQHYFEKNSWIFGYGLGYVFLSGLDDKKLEQVVQGYDFNESGKRVDALMKTKGVISNLCFIEIKKNNTELLEKSPYRAGCWSVSKELSGAVAQIQGTVTSAVETLSNQINVTDDKGDPTNETIFNYKPKSYLVVGNLKEFTNENGVNKEKLRSFELFRKNIISPEIITFDELYERARFIVQNNQADSNINSENNQNFKYDEDTDIPF